MWVDSGMFLEKWDMAMQFGARVRVRLGLGLGLGLPFALLRLLIIHGRTVPSLRRPLRVAVGRVLTGREVATEMEEVGQGLVDSQLED